MIKFGLMDEQQAYPVREAAYGLLINDDRIALVSTPRGYFLPGGGIENDESHEDCIIRELEEELGIIVTVKGFVAKTMLRDRTPSRDYDIDMIAHCYTVEDTGCVGVAVEDDHLLAWVTLDSARFLLTLVHQAWVIELLLKTRSDKLLSPYNKHWEAWFYAIEQRLKAALGDSIMGIEHIGSTAISGMLAKPIIDMDVVMYTDSSFDEVVYRLGEAGYQHNGNQGIEDREAFIRTDNDGGDDVLSAIPHHLYVCPLQSKELSRHIRLRDTLRQDDALRDAYKALKEEIIRQVGPNNREAYVAVKENDCHSFFMAVLGDDYE